MEDHRFDDLARRLGAPASRRNILRATVSGFAAVVAARFGGSAEAAGRCRSDGNSCASNGDCCSARCLPTPHRGRNLCCGTDSELCREFCKPIIEYQTDVDNCGSCGHVCPAGPICRIRACVAGVCGSAPDPSQNNRGCDDGNLCTVSDHCTDGTCAGTPMVCSNPGQCKTNTCNQSNGQCEVHNVADNTGCDDGNACTTGDHCVGGSCVATPVPCPACQHCAGGSCQNDADNSPAPGGGECCGGTAKDTVNDFSNCGSCGHACNSGQHCSGGTCHDQTCAANAETCAGNSACCSQLCTLGVCICIPSPPFPAVSPFPCLADENCCKPGTCLSASGVGFCTCLPIGAPCDHENQCCSLNCNKTPLGGRFCSPFN